MFMQEKIVNLCPENQPNNIFSQGSMKLKETLLGPAQGKGCQINCQQCRMDQQEKIGNDKIYLMQESMNNIHTVEVGI